MPDNPKARVFISCGQATEKERDIAVDIQDKIEQIGFEKPYIAVKEQDLGSVHDNIFFDKLEKCEYLFKTYFIHNIKNKYGKWEKGNNKKNYYWRNI